MPRRGLDLARFECKSGQSGQTGSFFEYFKADPGQASRPGPGVRISSGRNVRGRSRCSGKRNAGYAPGGFQVDFLGI